MGENPRKNFEIYPKTVSPDLGLFFSFGQAFKRERNKKFLSVPGIYISYNKVEKK